MPAFVSGKANDVIGAEEPRANALSPISVRLLTCFPPSSYVSNTTSSRSELEPNASSLISLIEEGIDTFVSFVLAKPFL